MIVMPGFNRRGPYGEGPLTGRKMGRCNPENKGKTDEEIILKRDESFQDFPGRGFGRGKSFGHGSGNGRGPGFRFRGNF